MNLKKKLVERRLNTVTKLMTTMRTLSYYVELLIGPIKCGFRQWVECSLALKTWKVQEKKWSFIGVTSFSHTFDFVLMYKRFWFNSRILGNRVPWFWSVPWTILTLQRFHPYGEMIHIFSFNKLWNEWGWHLFGWFWGDFARSYEEWWAN